MKKENLSNLFQDLRGLGLRLGVRRARVVRGPLGQVRGAGLDVLEQGLEAVRPGSPDGDRRLRLVDEDQEALVSQSQGDASRGLAVGVAVVVIIVVVGAGRERGER